MLSIKSADIFKKPLSARGAELRLLLVTLIWGFDFVAQKQGVLGSAAFFFNAASFGLGAIVVWGRCFASRSLCVLHGPARKGGIWVGAALFLAVSFQCLGIAETGAGKTAFISSLYVVLVPLLGLFFGHRGRKEIWVGCALAVAGLYFLCVHEDLSWAPSDLLILIGALFWTAHITLVGYFAPRADDTGLAFWEFLTCSLLSFVVSFLFESVSLSQVRAALWPILYNGIISAGVAYSLQISGQNGIPANRAALLLSMETIFAAVAGWLVLGETFGFRELLGSALMFAGVIISRRGG